VDLFVGMLYCRIKYYSLFSPQNMLQKDTFKKSRLTCYHHHICLACDYSCLKSLNCGFESRKQDGVPGTCSPLIDLTFIMNLSHFGVSFTSWLTPCRQEKLRLLKREQCLTQVDPMGDDFLVLQVLLRRKTKCR
jgi:hypothetical protein